MKKILSVILAAAALFTLAACKVKPSENKETEPYRPEEFQAQVSQLQAERASELAEQQKEKDKLNKEIDDYIAEIGKTKKGKELVLDVSSSRGREYQKYVFNKKALAFDSFSKISIKASISLDFPDLLTPVITLISGVFFTSISLFK